jgi:hypothetical protein
MPGVPAVATGVLLLVAGVVSPAPGQESPAHTGILLQKLVEPEPAGRRDTLTRDDLRELPPPRVDRLSDHVQFSAGVGDPRCLPGEDGLNFGRGRRPSGRR